MFIDIQGKSMSLCDPIQKLKLQQQQTGQGQFQGTIQRDGQLPNMIQGVNQIGNNSQQFGYSTNGVIQNSNQGILTHSNMNLQLIQNSTNKQPIKYNSPMGHQFKIGYSNKQEQLRQNQAQKYNQLYQLDPQLQQQQSNFQQSQYMQNIQLQQQLLMTSPQFKDQENSSTLFPSFSNGNLSTQYNQYLNNQKQINTNQIRENSGQNNYVSEHSPKSTTANQNSQFAANILRNSNVIQKQNEQRFLQIQHTHQLFSQLIMQNQQQNQLQQLVPSSQSPQPQQISQQPMASMVNQQQQQYQMSNNSQLTPQQQLMFASCENFGSRSTLYSCVGNPNNPYNHHLNNPYLQEKRYFKSSKLPKIRKESRLNSIASSEVRPSSREKSARFHLTASINSIVNQNMNQNGGVNQNYENLIDGKGSNQSNLEKSNVFNSETTIQLGGKSTSGSQSLSNQQSLTNIPLSTKESNQLSLTMNNLTNKKLQENINTFGDDQEEKSKCVRYFRYNLGQLLHILGKRESYFNNLNNKKPIKTYAIINQPLGVNKF